ncbi:MAG: T9SS type A sorting domain-containing protein, partial [Bacteroidetes bacterium]|nr:T9SS type A sorting domain-containing protein [Bacteroidota bacterium]
FYDPLHKGLNWHWYPNDSLISRHTKEPPFQSSSPEDGHLGLFLDGFDRWISYDTAQSMVNNAIEFPVIDCSDRSSVIVRYETNFMGGNTGGMEMRVSGNYGVHWAVWKVGFGCGHKERPDGILSGGSAIFETNISEVAAGSAGVVIKFYWWNSSYYYWLIDDFQLAEAFDYDLRMLNYSLEWDDGNPDTEVSFMYNIPKSQLGGAFANFGIEIFNTGEYDLNGVYLDVDISKNHQSIWHNATEPTWIFSTYTDTLVLDSTFYPSDFGHYKISYELNLDEPDQTPEDNSIEMFFNVTDSVYSYCDDISEQDLMYGYTWSEPEGETDEQAFVGSVFPIYSDTEVSSVSVYVVGGLADGLIEFRGAILFLPPENYWNGQEPIERLVSEIIPLDSSMFNTWVTLPFEQDGYTEKLFAGDVIYAGVEYWNWHEEKDPYRKYQNFTIGYDKGHKLKDPVNRARLGPFEGIWWWSYYTQGYFMVRLNLNDHSNIIDGIDIPSALNQLDQNYPNPAGFSTEIGYELTHASEVFIEILDMTGREVMKIDEGYQSVGKHTISINLTTIDSGIYFYTLRAGKFVDTRRMVVSK